MRAVDVALLLLFINVGIAVMAGSIGGHGLYQENRPKEMGKMPSEMSSGPENNYFPGGSRLGLTLGNIFTEPEKILAAVGIVFGIAALGGIFTNASILRIGGVSLFAGVFWWVWMEANSLISNPALGVPPWMINIITMIYGAVFFLAMIELLTGTRTEGY